jgi:hypothetical protein
MSRRSCSGEKGKTLRRGWDRDVAEPWRLGVAAVVFFPSFTDFGNLPSFTPSHHVDLPTGINLRIADRRRGPLSAKTKLSDISILRFCKASVLLLKTIMRYPKLTVK